MGEGESEKPQPFVISFLEEIMRFLENKVQRILLRRKCYLVVGGNLVIGW